MRPAALLALALAAPTFGVPSAARALPGGGLTVRMSLGSGAVETNGPSMSPAVANNGNVAYATFSTGLGFTDANDASDVVVGTAPGTNVLVSRTSGGTAANGASDSPAISADGRWVAFRSDATDLGVTETNGASDVYLLDRDPSSDGLDGADRSLSRVSQPATGGQANGPSDQPAVAVTPQGVFVAFRSSATNLAPPDRNGVADVFLRNVGTGTLTRVSVGAERLDANGPSGNPVLGGTASQVVVAFESLADNLALPDDGNGVMDVYARTIGATSETTLVSVSKEGDLANGASYDPTMTADGATIAFASDATNLVHSDTNGWTDVFKRTGLGTAVAFTASGRSDQPALSGDGRAMAVRTFAGGTGDTNELRDVYLVDWTNATTVISSVSDARTLGNGRSEQPALSAKGEYVAFRSDATNLVASDANALSDVFRRRRDVTAPLAPVLGGDATGVWTNDATIDVTVSAGDAATGLQSGLDGYGVVWNSTATTVPMVKTHEETATTLVSPPRSTSQSHWVHVRAVDDEGNWGPVVHRGPFWVDVTKPSVKLVVNGRESSFLLMTKTSTPLTVSGSDVGSGLDSAGFKIYYERARYDRSTAGYEPRVLWKATTETSHTFTGVLGYTYRFSVERRDKVGNLGSISESIYGNRYVVYPLDDTSATQASDTAWRTVTGTSYFGGEAQRSSTIGSYLRVPVRYAREVGILATICDGCGSVQMYIGGTAVGSPLSLDPAGTTTVTLNKLHSRDVSLLSGYLDLKVVTSGKPVTISGIVVRR